MIININKAELLKGQPIEPGWYKAKITEFRANTSKDGQSMNYIPVFELETPEQHVIDNHNFNSKLLSMMTPYLAALEKKSVKDFMATVIGSLSVDTEKHVGRKLKIKIKHDTWEGRIINRIDGFLPYDMEVPF